MKRNVIFKQEKKQGIGTGAKNKNPTLVQV